MWFCLGNRGPSQAAHHSYGPLSPAHLVDLWGEDPSQGVPALHPGPGHAEEVRDMGEGTGEKPLRTKSPRGQGGGAARVLVRVLPPYRVPWSFLKPQQEDMGWAPTLAGKEGGTKEARGRRDPCHEPQTSSLPKDLSRGNHRAGSIPTSPATRPESQAWQDHWGPNACWIIWVSQNHVPHSDFTGSGTRHPQGGTLFHSYALFTVTSEGRAGKHMMF